MQRFGADDLVVGERLSRCDHGAVDEVGHQVDVVDAVRGRLAHLGRERDELGADPERVRTCSREVGRVVGQLDAGDVIAVRGRSHRHRDL